MVHSVKGAGKSNKIITEKKAYLATWGLVVVLVSLEVSFLIMQVWEGVESEQMVKK